MNLILAECVRCGASTDWDDDDPNAAICEVCWDAGVSRAGPTGAGRRHRAQILEMAACGHSHEEIMQVTGLSRRTVYRHLQPPFNGTVVKAAPPGEAPHGSAERHLHILPLSAAGEAGVTSPVRSGAPTAGGVHPASVAPRSGRGTAAKKKAAV